jgi:hypothetical protein
LGADYFQGTRFPLERRPEMLAGSGMGMAPGMPLNGPGTGRCQTAETAKRIEAKTSVGFPYTSVYIVKKLTGADFLETRAVDR